MELSKEEKTEKEAEIGEWSCWILFCLFLLGVTSGACKFFDWSLGSALLLYRATQYHVATMHAEEERVILNAQIDSCKANFEALQNLKFKERGFYWLDEDKTLTRVSRGGAR